MPTYKINGQIITNPAAIRALERLKNDGANFSHFQDGNLTRSELLTILLSDNSKIALSSKRVIIELNKIDPNDYNALLKEACLKIKGFEQYLSPKLYHHIFSQKRPTSKPILTLPTSRPTTNPTSKPLSMPSNRMVYPHAIIDHEKLARYFGSEILRNRGVPEYMGRGKYIITMTTGDPTDSFLIRPVGGGKSYIWFYIDPKTQRITKIGSARSYSEIRVALNELKIIAPDLVRIVERLIQSAKRNNSAEIGEIEVPRHINIIFKEDRNMMSRVSNFEKKQSEKDKNELSTLLAGIPKPRYTAYSGNLNNVLTVAMAQFGVASRSSGKNVINTFGLGECIGLAIIDRKKGVVALAHITAMTKTNGLSKMLNRACTEGGQNFEAIIAQGSEDSTTLLAVVKFLKQNGVRISYVDRASNGNFGLSTDGRIFNNNFMGYPSISDQEMVVGGLANQILEKRPR